MVDKTKIQFNFIIENNNVTDIIHIMDIVEEKMKLLNIPFNKDNVLYNPNTNEIHIFGGKLNK